MKIKQRSLIVLIFTTSVYHVIRVAVIFTTQIKTRTKRNPMNDQSIVCHTFINTNSLTLAKHQASCSHF